MPFIVLAISRRFETLSSESHSLRRLAVSLFVVCLALDLGIKAGAQQWLHDPIRIFDWFYLAPHLNPSFALGFVELKSYSLFWFVHWVFVALVTVWLVSKLLGPHCSRLAIAYALIAAAFAGNLLGRASSGVLDYVAVGPVLSVSHQPLWAFFNLADVFALAGFGVAVWHGIDLRLRRASP